MCQYSSVDGFTDDWHLVHLGSRAAGGVGLVLTEGTAVSPEGRITAKDLGIWSDEHIDGLARVTAFVSSQGAVPGIQLAHAGRKGSTAAPWDGGGPLDSAGGGWTTFGPTDSPYDRGYPQPMQASRAYLHEVINEFAKASQRSVEAGFEVIELHFAHGYLVSSFLSPLVNNRKDEYGGPLLSNRARLALEITLAVRKVIPDTMPLFVKISATDWAPGGWDLKQTIQLGLLLRQAGVDLITCSSGGVVPNAVIPAGPGYQLPFSAELRSRTDLMTGGVGFITDVLQAEQCLIGGQADVVWLARELLRNPMWPLLAASQLGDEVAWPQQYRSGRPA